MKRTGYTPAEIVSGAFSPKLVINGGIINKVGQQNPPDDYLREWQKTRGIPDGSPVVVLAYDDFVRLAGEHASMMGW